MTNVNSQDKLMQKSPITTINISLCLLAVFMIQLLLSHLSWLEFSAADLSMMGGLSHDKVFRNNEWFRLFSCVFLHGGVIHLLLNLVALFMSGIITERLVGSRWLAIIFLVGGLSGSLFSLLINSSQIISVGASGAIMGVFASGLVLLSLVENKAERVVAQQQILRVLIPSLLPFLQRHGETIDFAAHLGGAVSGFLLGLCILSLFKKQVSWRHAVSTLLILPLALIYGVSIAMAISTISVNREINEHLNIAERLSDEKKYDQAIKEYDSVILKEPNLLSAHIGLATVYVHKENYDKCEEEYRVVTELLPSDVTVDLKATFHYLFAWCAENNKHSELALSQYQLALAINPTDSHTRMAYASFLKKSGQEKASLENYLMVPIGDLDYVSFVNIAGIYFSQKEYLKAVRYHKEAISKDPSSWSSYYNAALCYRLAGKADDAKRYYVDFLELAKKNLEVEPQFIDRAKSALWELEGNGH